MKQRIICLFLAALLTLTVTGCAAETTQSPSESRPAEAPKETEAAMVTEPAREEEHIAVVNNGGQSVAWGDALLYWKPTGTADQEAFDLILRTAEGETTLLEAASSESDIYVLGGSLFVNSGQGVTRIDPEKGNSELLEGMRVVGLEEQLGILVLYGSAEYYLYNGDTEKLDSVPESAAFFAMGDGAAYFTAAGEEDSIVLLYRLDLVTLECAQISQAESTYSSGTAPGYGYSGCLVEYIQETDTAIYYSYGHRGGSGNYYQPDSGGIIRVSKEDYTSTFLSGIGDTPTYAGPQFYVFQKDGNDQVLFYDGDYALKVMDMATGTLSDSDMSVGPFRKPFSTYSDGFLDHWIYPDMSGEVVHLLHEVSTDWENGVNTYFDNISYLGSRVVYDMIYQKENPNPTSWRDYTIICRREVYLYDLVTGETQLLAEMDY